MFGDVLSIALSAILINNFVLVRFLGICPFLGVSKKTDTALGMGMAVTFVTTLASLMTNLVYTHILERFNIEYLSTVTFILIIASLVQFVEMFLQKNARGLYLSLGIYLPLITTNCAVLGVALLNVTQGYDFIRSIIFGMTAGIGFALAIVLFSGIRERLESAPILKSFQGLPITLIAAGLMSIVFLGFQNLRI